MPKFEFIDITTADVAFKAYGASLKELFENAALAMFDVMIDLTDVQEKESRKISVEGEDLQSLMFNWLNELLYYVDAENLVFKYFDLSIDEEKLLIDALCKGEEIDRERHETKTVVKSATYHKMEIKKDKNWEATVILDI